MLLAAGPLLLLLLVPGTPGAAAQPALPPALPPTVAEPVQRLLRILGKLKPEPARAALPLAAEQLATTVGLSAACRALGVSRARVYRQRRPALPVSQGERRPSPRALTSSERTQVLATLHEDRFVDRAPAAVFAVLLEELPQH